MKLNIILACILLSACSSYQKPIVLTPSDPLIADCIISEPPKLTGNPEKDKIVLTQAWVIQTSNLGKCNQRMKMIQVWKKLQLERFGKDK